MCFWQVYGLNFFSLESNFDKNEMKFGELILYRVAKLWFKSHNCDLKIIYIVNEDWL